VFAIEKEPRLPHAVILGEDDMDDGEGDEACRMGGRSRGRRGVEGETKDMVVVPLWEGGGKGEAVSSM
jgi:hypothetical protein